MLTPRAKVDAAGTAVTLGIRGGQQRPTKQPVIPPSHATGTEGKTAAGEGGGDDKEVKVMDPFEHMTPAQARAARIRHDQARAAKAIAERRLKERSACDTISTHDSRASEESIPRSERDHRWAQEESIQMAHGRHFPHGFQAVEFAYGKEGMWKRVSNLCYEKNLFREHGSSAHPCDAEALEEACTTRQHTCCDLDGNLFSDPDRVGELRFQPDDGDHAFHEHNGLCSNGMGQGKRQARPRLLFFFDDNVLGHCISQIYGKPAPGGLEASTMHSTNKTFCRWQAVVSGMRKSPVSALLSPAWFARVEALWTNTSKVQQMALKGLYHVVNRNLSEAFLAWQWIRDNSGAAYDGTAFHFTYKRLPRTSDIALFKILTSSILECLEESKKIDSLAQSAWCELVDHWVALRVILLSSCVHTSWIGPSLHRRMNQRLKIAAEHTEGGRGTGWASGWAEGGDGLEMHGGSGRSVSSGVTFLAAIALGACCTFAFEPGCSPMQMDRKGEYLLRHHILSASYLKGSKAGLMLTGPFWNFAPGSYRVNYYLRARAPHHTATSTNEMALPPGDVCILEVRDAASGHAFSEVLSSMTLRPEDFGTGNHWSRKSLTFQVANPLCALDVRVKWLGNASLDIASLTVYTITPD